MIAMIELDFVLGYLKMIRSEIMMFLNNLFKIITEDLSFGKLLSAQLVAF